MIADWTFVWWWGWKKRESSFRTQIFFAKFGDLVLQKRHWRRHLDTRTFGHLLPPGLVVSSVAKDTWTFAKVENKQRISESWSFEQTGDEWELANKQWDPAANKHIPHFCFVCMAALAVNRTLMWREIFYHLHSIGHIGQYAFWSKWLKSLETPSDKEYLCGAGVCPICRGRGKGMMMRGNLVDKYLNILNILNIWIFEYLCLGLSNLPQERKGWWWGSI